MPTGRYVEQQHFAKRQRSLHVGESLNLRESKPSWALDTPRILTDITLQQQLHKISAAPCELHSVKGAVSVEVVNDALDSNNRLDG